MSEEDHARNNLPDVLAHWNERKGTELTRPRTAQSFCVPKEEIVTQGYDLSISRYKEVIHKEVEHRTPQEILAMLDELEKEIQLGMKNLRGMLG